LDKLNSSVPFLRVIHIAFLVSIGLFVWLGTFMSRTDSGHIRPLTHWFIAGLSLWCAITAFRFKAKLSGKIEERARDGGVLEPREIHRWKAGYFVAFACSQGIVLYGFLARILDASQVQVVPFYVAGTALLIWFWPRSVQ
jgi:hypothetical protein